MSFDVLCFINWNCFLPNSQPAEAYLAGVAYSGSAWFSVGKCQSKGVWANLFKGGQWFFFPQEDL